MTGPSPLIPDTPGRRRAWYHRSASLTSYPRDPGLTKLFHFHLALLLNYLNKMAKRVLLDRGADHQSCTGGARITAEGGSLKRDGADHQSCTGGARITAEGGSLKRDLRAGSVCLYVRLFGTVL